MNQNYHPIDQYDELDYEEIDIMEYVRKLLKNWRFILTWCGIAAVLGVVIALSAVSTYTVTTTVSPESASANTSGGSLSSLASLAGINLGSMGSSDAISPNLYPQIVSSVPFLTDLFYMPVEAEYKGEKIQCNYYEYLTNCVKTPWYKYVMSLPGRALGAVFGLFKPDEEKEPMGFKKLVEVDDARLTETQEHVIDAMRNCISVSTDKKTSLITLSVTDQNSDIAFRLSEAIVDKLQNYITTYRTGKSRKDLEYYEELYDKVQAEYFDAQQRYAEYVDMNQGVVRQSVKIEQERLENEMQLKYNLYNSCAQQVQVAKAQVQRATPVCTVITPPTIPTRDNESGAKTLAIFVFLGLCISAIWILWARDAITKLKELKEE